jgi:hypothetical protein
MKKQNKLSIKVRDLTPLNDVIGGRHRGHRGLFARSSARRGDVDVDVAGAGLITFPDRHVQ